MKIKSILLFLLALFYFGVCFAQQNIQGNIIDQESGEALAFVNIIFNNNPHLGTVSDIDGKFSFSSKRELNSISFSYVGYEKLTLPLDSLGNTKKLIIRLKASSVQLQEVTIKAKENPANRIIRKVIENKEVNNPEKIASFNYTSYNKSIYDFVYNDSLGSDSTKEEVNKLLKGGHILFMESVTQRKFIYPDLSEEIIIGSKVSGFRHPTFAPLATDLQPFSFYDDLIPILDINYLNPISNGSLNKYEFQLEDTLYNAADSIFIISYQPQAKKNFDGLTGLLYINNNKFAIQNVIAEPYEKGFISIKIQQKYQFIDGQQWFPQQLNYELILKHYPSKKVGMMVSGRSYIKDVELHPALEKSDFSIDAISMHKEATNRDSLFWQSHRTDSLNKKEKITYEVIDSLGEELNFDAFLHFFEKVAQGRIPLGPIDLDLTQTLIYNDYEGYRWGFGVSTNEKLSKTFSIGGFFGYGDDDHEWKYGADLTLFLNKEKEFELKAAHLNTIKEVGKSNLNYFSKNPYDLRSYLAYRMDRIYQNSMDISFRAFKYAKMSIGIHHDIRETLYDYKFVNGTNTKEGKFTNAAIEFNLRYAFREKLIKSLGQRISLGTNYPILYLSYSRGLDGFYFSEYEYNKIEGRVEKSFLTRSFGETRLRLDLGYIDKILPYSLLFTAEGSFNKDMPYVVKNYFQTVKPYEFLSDQYMHFFLSHNFKSLLFEYKNFKPHLSIYQNMGWGSLSNAEQHQQIEFQTKEKGLFESGLIIDNIISLNYLNIGYLGFGLGTFYRYGAYTSDKEIENFAFKFSMSFRTK